MKAKLYALRDWAVENKGKLIVASIILLAAFFRFWQLGSIPYGLYADEAVNGLDALAASNGDIKPFYTANNGREGLFILLQGLSVFILGNTILALRLVPAIIGVLAVWATYLFVNETFSKRAAMLSAFMMASAPWAVTMSRLGFRAGFIVLLLPLLGWLVVKALKTKRPFYWAMSGIVLGFGFYTYISWRALPVALGLIAVFALIYNRKKFIGSIKYMLIAGLTALIAILPLGIYTYQHPEEVLAVRSSVSFTNPELNEGQPLITLAHNIGETALMFNSAGDQNWRHNLAGEPMLNAFVGILFLLGLILSIRRIKDIRYFTLLAVFAAMLLPMVLTAEGIPHSLRAIGLMPVVYILAAIGLVELIFRWRGIFPKNPASYTMALAIVALLLSFSTFYNYKRYFVAYANAPEMYAAFNEAELEIADYLNNKEWQITPKVITDPHDNSTILYLTKNKTEYEFLKVEEAGKLTAGDTLILARKDKQELERHLEEGLILELEQNIESEKQLGTVLARVYSVIHKE
ncbi:MAG: glycosyltransferase family 39 protein [Candidatus Saccharimonadales bacterium]